MSSATELTSRVADAMVTGPKVHRANTTTASIVTFFQDDHVHMALIVADDGRLVTTIERPDLTGVNSESVLAAASGTLVDRTIGPDDPIETALTILRHGNRRRLAVVGEAGELLGLLCLKRDNSGYCSDENVREREAERTRGL